MDGKLQQVAPGGHRFTEALANWYAVALEDDESCWSTVAGRGAGVRWPQGCANSVDVRRERQSLAVFASIEADVLLPGHGDAFSGPVAAAAAEARDG